MRVVEAVARECPGVTYDVTIKVEHLLRHRQRLPQLRDTGCLFVTSAVESFDDEVLDRLHKGHTRADVHEALEHCRAAGLTVSPTFVPFNPWTTLDGYCAFLREIDRLQLVDHVAPIQLAIRLLVTQGSRLLDLPDLSQMLRPFDHVRLVYPWQHRDPRVERLCDELAGLVGRRLNIPRRESFAEVWELAHARAGKAVGPRAVLPPGRVEIPYLNEPWYC